MGERGIISMLKDFSIIVTLLMSLAAFVEPVQSEAKQMLEMWRLFGYKWSPVC